MGMDSSTIKISLASTLGNNIMKWLLGTVKSKNLLSALAGTLSRNCVSTMPCALQCYTLLNRKKISTSSLLGTYTIRRELAKKGREKKLSKL